MLKLMGITGLFILCTAATSIGSDRASCSALAGPTADAASGFSAMYTALTGFAIDDSVARQFTEEDLEALLAFEQARQELVPAMRVLLERTEDLAYRMQKCSR